MAAVRFKLAISLFAICAGVVTIVATGHAGRGDWRTIGHDAANSRNQPLERTLGRRNVDRLLPKWIAETTGDVSDTPAVADGAVYFSDFGGTLWKLDAETGQVMWSESVAEYTGHSGDYARTSPSLAGNTLVIGVLRLQRRWKVDPTPSAQTTRPYGLVVEREDRERQPGHDGDVLLVTDSIGDRSAVDRRAQVHLP